MPIIPKAKAMVESVEALLEEKLAVTEKEKKVVKAMNSLLSRIGYQVVPSNSKKAPGRKRRKRLGRRVGRPSGRKPGRPRGGGVTSPKVAQAQL